MKMYLAAILGLATIEGVKEGDSETDFPQPLHRINGIIKPIKLLIIKYFRPWRSLERTLLKMKGLTSSKASPFESLNYKNSYLDLPILNILVPQVGQVPWVAGFLFFIVTALGLFISFLALHLTQ